MTDDEFPYNYTDDPIDDITTLCDYWELWLQHYPTTTTTNNKYTD
jgi:hypothetical protein